MNGDLFSTRYPPSRPDGILFYLGVLIIVGGPIKIPRVRWTRVERSSPSSGHVKRKFPKEGQPVLSSTNEFHLLVLTALKKKNKTKLKTLFPLLELFIFFFFSVVPLCTLRFPFSRKKQTLKSL